MNNTTATRREDAKNNIRYTHVSCEAYMIDDPRTLKDGIKRPQIPFVTKGVTYNAGKNKAKREKRVLSL